MIGRPAAVRLALRMSETGIIEVLRGCRRWNAVRTQQPGWRRRLTGRRQCTVYTSFLGGLLMTHPNQAESNG